MTPKSVTPTRRSSNSIRPPKEIVAGAAVGVTPGAAFGVPSAFVAAWPGL